MSVFFILVRTFCFHVTFYEWAKEKGNFIHIIQSWGHWHTHESYWITSTQKTSKMSWICSLPHWFLSPLYSVALPLRNTLRVGYPVTSYFCASSESTVASTLARVMGGSFSFSSLAAFSYSGASLLQWPHL